MISVDRGSPSTISYYITSNNTETAAIKHSNFLCGSTESLKLSRVSEHKLHVHCVSVHNESQHRNNMMVSTGLFLSKFVVVTTSNLKWILHFKVIYVILSLSLPENCIFLSLKHTAKSISTVTILRLKFTELSNWKLYFWRNFEDELWLVTFAQSD